MKTINLICFLGIFVVQTLCYGTGKKEILLSENGGVAPPVGLSEDSSTPRLLSPPPAAFIEDSGKPWIDAGWAIFGLSWGATVGYAAFNRGTYSFIPVVGPFLQLSDTTTPGLCIASGIAQSVGVSFMIIGAVKRSNSKRRASSFQITPVISDQMTGLAAALRF